MATYYYLGRGVEQDLEKAPACYRLAGNRGHPESLLNLANVHRFGYAVPNSAEEAKKYYNAAAHFGQGTSVGRAAEESISSIDVDEPDAKWEGQPETFIEPDERADTKFRVGSISPSCSKGWGG